MAAMKTAKASPGLLKILMLHGFTQSGPLFHAKTKALEKHLHKAFPGAILSYPTGPLKLNVREIPGLQISEDNDEDPEAYAWWRRMDGSDPPEYTGLDQGLAALAKIIAEDGPFDGVMGFSQGAAMAAMISSLLEGESRRTSFQAASQRSSMAIPYPASFESLNQPQLKFCILYSGFAAPGERYAGFYQPSIETPACHFVGSLDTVVEEARTDLLIKAFGGENKTSVIVHPGGHFVPSQRQYLDAVASFIKAQVDKSTSTAQIDEKVEDMDVPF